MRSFAVVFMLLASLAAASAQSMSDEAFGRHVGEHFRSGSPSGKHSELAIRVVALPTGELVAPRIPVPAADDGWANSHLLIGCNEAVETKPWRAYRLTASSSFTHFDDTEAFETRQAPRFVVMLESCRLEEEAAAPGDPAALRERNLALRHAPENLHVGPTFVCSDPSKCSGLARTVLAESAAPHLLGPADIALVQPYQVLRHAFPVDRQKLRAESGAFTEAVVKECRIPKRITAENPHGNPEGTERYAPCIAKAYERQRGIWLNAVAALPTAGALEEARRPAVEHRFLQFLLKFHGYLPETTRIDGAYGEATRTAVVAAQTAAGLPTDGFMSDALARLLESKP